MIPAEPEKTPAGSTRPLTSDEMAALMAPFGPFEPAPEIAVGVSGGPDSLCLALLVADWAAARGGRAVALIVDHGLRPGSGREARWTRAQLASRGITAHILRWTGDKPQSNRQSAARAARLRLLTDYCARRGVLHLALAHHQDDQAETFLLRLARGSGLDGLAAMAPLAGRPDLRLLRPLLPVPKARLLASLRALGQEWAEDPSNRDPQFDRVRWRRLAPDLARLGLSSTRLATTAAQLGRARGALEQGLAELAARAITLDPAGFAWLDRQNVMAAEPELGLRLLSRLLAVLGGADYPPRLARLERLYGRLEGPDFRGATLGGCRIQPRPGRLLVVREWAKAPAVPVTPGERLLWDGRFQITVSRASGRLPRALHLAALGQAGARSQCDGLSEAEKRRIPGPARLALPALWAGDRLLCVPHLSDGAPGNRSVSLKNCDFRPKNSLIGTWLRVA